MVYSGLEYFNDACRASYHLNLPACNVCSEKWRLRPEAESAQNCTAGVGQSLIFAQLMNFM